MTKHGNKTKQSTVRGISHVSSLKSNHGPERHIDGLGEDRGPRPAVRAGQHRGVPRTGRRCLGLRLTGVPVRHLQMQTHFLMNEIKQKTTIASC